MVSVHLYRRPEPEHLAFLRDQLLPTVRVTVGEAVPEEANYQILVAGRFPREFLEVSPSLHSVIVPFAGIPTPTRALLAEFPQVALYNLHHNAPAVAELVMSLLLSAAKLLIPFDQNLRKGDWSGKYQPNDTLMLAGKTALILGYGAIGQRVAGMCRAFGMTVVGTRRRVSGKEIDEVYPSVALPYLLPRADVLIITLPLTPETQGLIGRRELRLLPSHAIVINVGRGDVLDEEALYMALKNGEIHAAGIDVWYQYPPDEQDNHPIAPSHFPLHELDNIVMSPHRGGLTDETEFYRMTALAILLNAAARGETMPNRVDLNAGY